MEWKSECFDFPLTKTDDVQKRCFTCGLLHSVVLRRCTGCYGPRFCNEKCQRKGWPVHQRFCKSSDLLIQHLSRETAAAEVAMIASFLIAFYSKPKDHKAFAQMMETLQSRPVHVDHDKNKIFAAKETWILAQDACLKEYSDLRYSGCNQIWPRLVFMSAVSEGKYWKLPGPLTAMSLFLQNAGESVQNDRSLFFHILPAWTVMSEDQYPHRADDITWSELQEGIQTPGCFIFLVKMECSEKKQRVVLPPPPPRAASEKEILQSFEGPSFRHSFILAVYNRSKSTETVLLQSFAGYYSLRQWCDWKQPLVAASAPPEFNRVCQILSAPRYRGKLNSQQRIHLIADLKRLNNEKLSSKARKPSFAHLTGVDAPLDWFPTRFDFKIVRFQADCFWGGV